MPAKIIAVFNQKGGSGKTTTSTNLAGALGMRGYRTMLVDLDEQGTATLSVGAAPDDRPYPAAISNLALSPRPDREIAKYVNDYDFIVIDCPPAIKSAAPSVALLISDLGLIPIAASGGNLWAVQEAKKLGMEAQIRNPDLKLRSFANMNQNVTIVKQIFEAAAGDAELPMLKTKLGFRTAYKEAEVSGATVLQLRSAKAAHKELNDLVDEVLEVLEVRA
ncbi:MULTISPECIES: AAA family ATPase [Burkholderia]|uniref:AAA family ATPase n=1 Tax=Burkholderia TaxID=32008 RepID=UPI00050E928E|nr:MULTISPECIES: AAA family ATPase [Burkholderia]AIV73682.1 AAA domain protein [Burkholderia pseudomallei]KGD55138.1 cobQ/CobB/MinD/ParA nucleotide binding domain protein [Burkholderia pseudomallei]KGW18026.1 cobQ/CobB/MinD/ParA nucleotide binding domain protein [Burkholderia pseudomallei MSHR4000]KGW78499.1 AAA domain protein [Burkholderia pseudomallei MSHR2990]KGW81040.1 cobQ/CobB/MinD/ParA nucleotide binding domain protein [Burkholderia pseudomallei MSHR456]